MRALTANWIKIGCAAFVLINTRTAFADQQELQAVLANHFLRHHYAIPLHSNGNVKSGDLLHMPEEATLAPRDTYYNLPPVRYTRIPNEYVQTSSSLAAEAGGQMPVRWVRKIEAEIGGKLEFGQSILLAPLSQEEPPGGYAVLEQPKSTPTCAVNFRTLNGTAKDLILVTRVFHGSLAAEATSALGDGAKIGADIGKKLQEFVGGDFKVQAQVSGSTFTLQYSKSEGEHSLAAQSAFIDPEKFAKIYFASRTDNGILLDALVRRALTGYEPDVVIKVRVIINNLLRSLGLKEASARALYSSAFSGERTVPMVKANPPQEHWDLFAIIAAAHEYVAER